MVQAKRLKQFQMLKSTVMEFWENLEDGPKTSLEKEMAASDSKICTVVLSAANIDTLKTLQLELEHQKNINIGIAKRLRDDIQSLWSKLEIPEKETKPFLDRWYGMKPSTISAYEGEILRLEPLKRKNLQRFIDELRNELIGLWDKCQYGPEQREMFSPMNDTNYTEVLLAIHEHQVGVMKGYYEQNKRLFKMVEKRETMFEKMKEYETTNKLNHSGTTRGGILLKELQKKGKLEKELPKIEKELREEVAKWEAENEQKFMVNGKQLIEQINEQWENLKHQKEEIKLERHKRKHENMKNELLYGSVPVATPRKRQFAGTTLSKTPAKIGAKTFSTPKPQANKLDVVQSPTLVTTSSITKRPSGLPPKASKKAKVDVQTPCSSTRLEAKQMLGGKAFLNFVPKGKIANESSSIAAIDLEANNSSPGSLSCADYKEFTDGLENVSTSSGMKTTGIMKSQV